MKLKRKNFFFIIYIISITIFFFIIYKFNLQSYFEKNSLIEFVSKVNNLEGTDKLKISIIFFIASIIWIIFLGISTPICIVAGSFFSLLYGTLLAVLSISVGSLTLFILSKYFLNDFFYNFFKKTKNKKYIKFLNQNIFIKFIIFRFIPGIPLALKNILPSFTNIKATKFFIGTIIADTPNIFLNVYIVNNITFFMKDFKNFNFLSIFFFITFLIIIFLITKKINFFVKKKYKIKF